VHHVGILYDQFMMHGQRNIKLKKPVYLFPPRTRRPPGPTWTNFVVLQMFGDNFVHNCTRHFRTLFIYFANCEMSILSNDAVHLLLQCICDDRGSSWSLSVAHS